MALAQRLLCLMDKLVPNASLNFIVMLVPPGEMAVDRMVLDSL